MLHQYLKNSAASFPERLALVCGCEALTYRELSLRVDHFVAALVVADVQPGSVVAIYASRSADMVAAMIATCKAGAAYTVVERSGNLSADKSRLDSIVFDVFMTDSESIIRVPDKVPKISIHQAKQESLEGMSLPDVAGDGLAYVVYTSGTTGKPKGVCITHSNVAFYTQSVNAVLHTDSVIDYGHISTFAADLGNTSLFLCIFNGGTLHIIDDNTRKDPQKLASYLIDKQIQFLKITPSHWAAVFNGLSAEVAGQLPLSHLILGGEPLYPRLAAEIISHIPSIQLFNHYGPSECTVGSAVFPITLDTLAEIDDEQSVPIGYELNGSKFLISDSDTGVYAAEGIGELYISGPGVSPGYLNNPEETAKRFKWLNYASVSEGSLKFYATGDIVSITDEGRATFLGRIDRQVKINGYRVELEHVETVLRSRPGIVAAACLVDESSGKSVLHGFIQCEGGVSEETIRKGLESSLAHYMVPKRLHSLKHLPVTTNGKIDYKFLTQVLPKIQAEPMVADTSSSLADQLASIIARLTGQSSIGREDDFFELGGDSMDAILLMAEIQNLGYSVSTERFFLSPTLDGLIKAIEEDEEKPSQTRESIEYNCNTFSPAQHHFLYSEMEDYDWNNQAILLEAGNKVDPILLRDVIAALCSKHELLTTSFHRDSKREWRHEQYGWQNDTFSYSQVCGNTHSSIRRAAMSLHRSIDLSQGKVFRCHLFKNRDGSDLVLLVAHHLVVDLLSWRILISEMAENYSRLLNGQELSAHPVGFEFFEWAAHLYRETPPAELPEVLTSSYTSDKDNTEGNAQTIWMGFEQAETLELTNKFSKQSGTHISNVVLAAFAQAYTSLLQHPEVIIETESHGRKSFREDLDISRSIGWHTSTFPVRLQRATNLIAMIQQVERQFSGVPNLGIAYGIKAVIQGHAQPSVAKASILFNFLGDVDISTYDALNLSLSTVDIGHGRCPENNRLYEYKLTGRIIHGCLILDLACPGPQINELAKKILVAMKRMVVTEANINFSHPNMLTESGTRTGLISYAPSRIISAKSSVKDKDYRNVLLTGATGFLGAYALKELLGKTKAHIYCLVRKSEGVSAERRLQRLYKWYFPHLNLEDFKNRLTVLTGDITAARLGLTEESYLMLCQELDSIYHFAADTKLFGSEKQFERSNVQPVHQLVALAKEFVIKDMHYVSTLAVCGVNRGPSVVRFSESDSDINQHFQNYYESSKFKAERVVNEFSIQTGRGFIYRTGNVSAHSKSSRFQVDGFANRFIQFLNACIQIGRLPRDLGGNIVLSPVDEVVSGMIAISLSGKHRSGVFHVDSSSEISMTRIFDSLRRSGCHFAQTELETFADIFRGVSESNKDIALGRMWSLREPRRVEYDSSRTLAILDSLGLGFSNLSDDWLDRFFKELIELSVISQSQYIENVS